MHHHKAWCRSCSAAELCRRPALALGIDPVAAWRASEHNLGMQVVKEAADKPREITYKGATDLVTDTDQRSEKEVLGVRSLCTVTMQSLHVAEHLGF